MFLLFPFISFCVPVVSCRFPAFSFQFLTFSFIFLTFSYHVYHLILYFLAGCAKGKSDAHFLYSPFGARKLDG